MVQDAVDEAVAAAQQAMGDPEVAETPEFLGGPYNLVIWKPKTAEHEFFRNRAPKVGEMAPDFTLPNLDGGEFALSSLRGKPLVIEFGSIT